MDPVLLDNGVTRTVLAHDPALMLVAFDFPQGAVGADHSHPHVQISTVASGRFRFAVAGEAREMGPGDTVAVPSGAVHGCTCLEAGRLIDAFAPARADFL